MTRQQRREQRCKDTLRRRSGGRCEACDTLNPGIRRPGLDKHEIKSRARGGDPTDPNNCMLVCRQCHDWIEANDGEAILLGFSKHSWQR
jgi:5-methylcytosine-specific restriction endonuclease McrA